MIPGERIGNALGGNKMKFNVDQLRDDLRRQVSERGIQLTFREIGEIADSIALMAAADIKTGDDISGVLKQYPAVANAAIDELERNITLIDATRYVVEDMLKVELNSTVKELFTNQFDEGVTSLSYTMSLLKDLKASMDAYCDNDEKNLGPVELRNQIDALNEASEMAKALINEPGFAHPVLAKLKSVCQNSDAFKEEFSRRWQLAQSIADNRTLMIALRQDLKPGHVW
jgi:hypothetical protein